MNKLKKGDIVGFERSGNLYFSYVTSVAPMLYSIENKKKCVFLVGNSEPFFVEDLYYPNTEEKIKRQLKNAREFNKSQFYFREYNETPSI